MFLSLSIKQYICSAMYSALYAAVVAQLLALLPSIIFGSMVLLILFVGHLVQIAIWATLFMYLGEFSDFLTAFYHSTVNFASLGYGDIVMSEKWRLLGALEASNGVLMFGLSAGTMLSVMTNLFSHHRESEIKEIRNAN